jgi:predicted Abi (CAAX) family protease
MRKFTKIFTCIGLALCLVHYLFHDFDSIYLLFYSLSVPAWFAPLFTNVVDISGPKLMVIYLLTVAVWALIGYVIDRFSVGYSRRRSR